MFNRKIGKIKGRSSWGVGNCQKASGHLHENKMMRAWVTQNLDESRRNINFFGRFKDFLLWKRILGAAGWELSLYWLTNNLWKIKLEELSRILSKSVKWNFILCTGDKRYLILGRHPQKNEEPVYSCIAFQLTKSFYFFRSSDSNFLVC